MQAADRKNVGSSADPEILIDAFIQKWSVSEEDPGRKAPGLCPFSAQPIRESFELIIFLNHVKDLSLLPGASLFIRLPQQE